MRVIKNGNVIDMSYENICKTLGFDANVHFVKVTTRRTIGFTVGKPNEIKDLYRAIVENDFKPTHKLADTIETL